MTWRTRHLYLIGLPGAGKSAIGSELQNLVGAHGFEFLDLDQAIEQRAGKTIGELFREDGEQRFREIETEALIGASQSNGHYRIIATGGGAVLSPLNRAIMRGSGVTIWIDVTAREAAKNILADIERGHERPMFRDASMEGVQLKLRSLLEQRRPFYEQAQLHFVTRSANGSEYTPKELALEMQRALEQMSLRVALHPRFRTIVAKSALGNYPIFIGNGCAARELPGLIGEMAATQVAIVTDENVAALHLDAIAGTIASNGSTPHVIVLRAGESHKTMETLESLLASFKEIGLNRKDSVVIALGGGVVTDIAGLGANLYHRGLPLISIPTTLIAQCDAAIGGKTGIDYLGGKNLIGTFYAPRNVLVDPTFLKTLPERELHAGLAEVFKYALIGSRELWDKLAAIIRRLVRGVDQRYEEVVAECIEQKLRYVEADEFERKHGLRELLNFGHTFGHALESATGFEAFRHGEAVLIGMRAATWLSAELGHISQEARAEIESVLSQIPIAHKAQIQSSEVLRSMKQDKKQTSVDGFRVILLRAIGEAFVARITESQAIAAVESMLNL